MTDNEIIKSLHNAIKNDRTKEVKAILLQRPDLVDSPHPRTRKTAIEIGTISKRTPEINSLISVAEGAVLLPSYLPPSPSAPCNTP